MEVKEHKPAVPRLRLKKEGYGISEVDLITNEDNEFVPEKNVYDESCCSWAVESNSRFVPECEPGRHPEYQQPAGGKLEVQADAWEEGGGASGRSRSSIHYMTAGPPSMGIIYQKTRGENNKWHKLIWKFILWVI